MNTIKNNQFIASSSDFNATTPESNQNNTVSLIKEDLERGLFILDYRNSKHHIIECHKNNINNLLKLLNGNTMISSKINIIDQFHNVNNTPQNRNIDQVTTNGYTISYDDKNLVKIIFIENRFNHLFTKGYSNMSDFSIEYYDDFHNMCRAAGINSSSFEVQSQTTRSYPNQPIGYSRQSRNPFNPASSENSDFFLERDDYRKSKEQLTADFDEEYPKRLVSKSNRNYHLEKLATTTDRPIITGRSRPTIPGRPIIQGRPAIMDRSIIPGRPAPTIPGRPTIIPGRPAPTIPGRPTIIPGRATIIERSIIPGRPTIMYRSNMSARPLL